MNLEMDESLRRAAYHLSRNVPIDFGEADIPDEYNYAHPPLMENLPYHPPAVERAPPTSTASTKVPTEPTHPAEAVPLVQFNGSEQHVKVIMRYVFFHLSYLRVQVQSI